MYMIIWMKIQCFKALQTGNVFLFSFIPLFARAVRLPPQNSAEAKKLG
ncbi:hypothetical protein B4117_5795 [Bacillus mycoides]|nr:hypothetical protein B4117_5795 [Bacillus mycoides]